MTLTETLQIKERFLKFEDMRALDYVEKRWKETGEPTDRWEIINFLERMLQELKNQGGYPKILLLRKKEIQRRTYTIPNPAKRKTPEVAPVLAAGFPQAGRVPAQRVSHTASSYGSGECGYEREKIATRAQIVLAA